MSGRRATTDVHPGDVALSVGMPETPTPDGWRWVKLSEVATMATGHTPSRKHPEYWGGSIHWMTVRDARPNDGKSITETAEQINQFGLKNSAAVLLPEGTVCLSRTGSIGYSVILGRPMATSQGFVNWICGEELVPQFLQLLYLAERPFLYRISEGVAHTTIYFPEVKAFHVCIPPVEIQKQIVTTVDELLSDLNAGVAALERAQATLKRYRAALLKAAVEGKLTEQWRAERPEVEPASALLERILAERRDRWPSDDRYRLPVELQNIPSLPIPDRWQWVSLDTVLREKLRNGKSAKEAPDGLGVRTLTLSAVTLDDFSEVNTKITVAKPQDVDSLWLRTGDIFVERSNAPELVGTAALYRGADDFAIFPDLLIRVRVSSRVAAEYVETVLRSTYGRRYLKGHAKGISSSMPKIDQGTLSSFPVPLPPLAEQQEIVKLVSECVSVIDHVETTISYAMTKAGRLRSGILKSAFEGELCSTSRHIGTALTGKSRMPLVSSAEVQAELNLGAL